MKHERRDLERLFAPAPDRFGTHMLLCGLSADTETLERIVSTFTGEGTVERAARGLVRAVLMLDASSPPLSPLAVPGLQRLTHCPLEHWRAHTSLMHAKVALLGFADEPFAAPTSFRLIVSTGNWTGETWGSGPQIDMFWSTECRIDPVHRASDAYVDVSAALAFFERLMGTLYPQSAAFLEGRELAMGWLANWRTLLGQGKPNRRPRFVHSLDASLSTQVSQRFPKEGVSSLVAGSGFWEQAGRDPGAMPKVVQGRGKLAVRGKRYLVVNPGQAGALAQWVGAKPKTASTGRIDGWTLCTPLDPLQPKKGAGRSFLHAKYIAGLARVASARQDKGTMTFLYLGSGNLSCAGFLSTAGWGSNKKRPSAGNVEAGVVLTDKQEVSDVWRALACGDVLPDTSIKAMESGSSEPILVPQAPPPVLFAHHVDARLRLVRSIGVMAALEVRLDAVGPWLGIGVGEDALPLTGNPPPMVWVRLPPDDAGATPQIHEVPVYARDGTCCRQAPHVLEIDDVLEALLAFPSFPPGQADPESPQSPAAAARPVVASRYPLKSMATLIEAIAQRNAVLTREQFPVWLSELRYLLLEQVADADRYAIAATGVNLFPALLEPGFAPPWLDEVPQLALAYRSLVGDIVAHWTAPTVQTGTPAWFDRRRAA